MTQAIFIEKALSHQYHDTIQPHKWDLCTPECPGLEVNHFEVLS
jgi:hypothetical protein